MRNTSARATSALALLCVVQGCERFAFFTMLPLFVLYLRQCYGFNDQHAVLVLGVSQALAYCGALPAGALIDRGFPCHSATLLGCALLTLGYGALALDRSSLLWPALGLLIVGHSFFKPGLTTLVKAVSRVEHSERSRAFLHLHLVVNIGAWVGPLCGEQARAQAGWPAVFLCSGLGTLAGTLLLRLAPRLTGVLRAVESPVSPSRMNTHDRERIRAVWLICGVALIFWLSAQQAGSSLTLFAERHTETLLVVGSHRFTLGPGHFASLHALFVLALLPLSLSTMPRLRAKGIMLSSVGQMAWGYVATAGAFALLVAASLRGGDMGRVSPLWLSSSYLFLSLAEVWIAPLGLELITELAPPRLASRAVGLWFLVAALGSGLSGIFGMLWGHWANHLYFSLLALLSLGVGLVLLIELSFLRALLRRISASPMAASMSGSLR